MFSTRNMIRVPLYLLLLEVCFATTPDPVPSDVLKVTYLGPPGLPSFPHSIDIGDIQDTSKNFTINYRDVSFYNLSNAYSIRYEIDFHKHKVLTVLTCGKTMIQGLYSLFPNFTSNSTAISFSSNSPTINKEFLMIIYQMKLAYETVFQVHNGTVIFEKPFDKYPKIGYTVSKLFEDLQLQRFQHPKLLDAVSDKLFAEVHQIINLDDVGSHIKRHWLNKRLAAIGARFKSTIYKILERDDFHSNIFDVYYFDTTNITTNIILPIISTSGSYAEYELTLPSFRLYAKEKFVLPVNIGNITFAEDGVHLRSVLYVPSPRFVAKMVSRQKNKPMTQNDTVSEFVYELELRYLKYEFRMLASLKTASVTLEHASTKLHGGLSDNDQDPFSSNDKDYLISKLSGNLIFNYQDYIGRNCGSTFENYMRGIMANGAIEETIFEEDHQQVPASKT